MHLDTTYMGLCLRNPLVASAGPIQQSLDGIRALADSGVGAIVFHSLMEEQIRAEQDRTEQTRSGALSSVPSDATSVSAQYLGLLEQAASAVDVPIIGSLNGSTTGGWISFARRMQDAGAAALELNIYYIPGDVTVSSEEVENLHLEILVGVKDAVTIPVAVKLTPYFSSLGSMAVELDQHGADGLVLFNRFFQPDIDIEALTMKPGVSYSTSADGTLPRTWIANLRGRVRASLAGSSGVETAEDVVKYLLAGADVAMSTSSLVRYGPRHATSLLSGLEKWMQRHRFESVDSFRGMLAVPDGLDIDRLERQGYVAGIADASDSYQELVASS